MLSLVFLNKSVAPKLAAHAGKIAGVSALVAFIFFYNVAQGPESFLPETSPERYIVSGAGALFACDALRYFLVHRNRSIDGLENFLKKMTPGNSLPLVAGVSFISYGGGNSQKQISRISRYCSHFFLQRGECFILQKGHRAAVIWKNNNREGAYTIFIQDQQITKARDYLVYKTIENAISNLGFKNIARK